MVVRETRDGEKRYHVVYRHDGRQRWRTFTKRKAAEHFLGETVDPVHKGVHRELISTTFADYAAAWLGTLGNLKPSTRATYTFDVTHHLIPAFRSALVHTIGPDAINAWLAQLAGGDLAVKTRQNLLATAHRRPRRAQIHVRRSLYKGEYFLPKTRTSKRSIDVGDQVLGVLAALERERYGEGGAPAEAPVFVTVEGAPVDPVNFRQRAWAPALKAAGLRHVTLHSLRHTYARALIAQGESVLYVQRQLGHSTPTLTLNVYSHLLEKREKDAEQARRRAATTRLDAALFGVLPSNSPLTDVAVTADNGEYRSVVNPD